MKLVIQYKSDELPKSYNINLEEIKNPEEIIQLHVIDNNINKLNIPFLLNLKILIIKCNNINQLNIPNLLSLKALGFFIPNKLSKLYLNNLINLEEIVMKNSILNELDLTNLKKLKRIKIEYDKIKKQKIIKRRRIYLLCETNRNLNEICLICKHKVNKYKKINLRNIIFINTNFYNICCC